MNVGKTLFSQLMECLPWSTFAPIVSRYHGDHSVRTFPCAEQYLDTAFAQLAYRGSLGDIEACRSAPPMKLWHMGFRGSVRRSMVADANQARDWRIYAALDWPFSAVGDKAIGVALAAAAVPLWFQLSLVDECLSRVQQALGVLDATPGQDPRRRMQLYAALGRPRMRAITGLPDGAVAWRETLRLAELIGDLDYQQRALWALWVDRTNSGEPREALVIAEKFSALAVATGELAEEKIGDRMRARSLYLLGDLARARDDIGRMLDGYVPPTRRSHIARFQYDQRLVARITLSLGQRVVESEQMKGLMERKNGQARVTIELKDITTGPGL